LELASRNGHTEIAELLKKYSKPKTESIRFWTHNDLLSLIKD
jgi:hypothetical protein